MVPEPTLRFVADQVGAAPEAIATYDARPDALGPSRRTARGIRLRGPHARPPSGLAAWLLPVALATTSPMAVAAALMEEARRRQLIVPGASVVEELTAAALTAAERHVAHQISGRIKPAQADALDALLATEPGASMSVLAWARQPPGAPGHRALARLVEALERLQAIGLDSACTEGVHPISTPSRSDARAGNSRYVRTLFLLPAWRVKRDQARWCAALLVHGPVAGGAQDHQAGTARYLRVRSHAGRRRRACPCPPSARCSSSVIQAAWRWSRPAAATRIAFQSPSALGGRSRWQVTPASRASPARKAA